ncbi:MAG TPA: flagellar basal body protein FliL [Gammaproteobacteria bacterium]|nr:flagellar basal body protein FliL [Gammaproteobacteria bacterium]HBG52105.1 flagellar basal body protein FliL [Gammaproteobacteria bacterium]
MAQQIDPAPAAPRAGRSKTLILIVVLALALGAGAAAGAWFLWGRTGPGEAQSDPVAGAHAAASTVFFTLEPSFVVNFELPSPVRFLQVTVELELGSAADEEAVKKHQPVIRNNLLLLFSAQDYEGLRTREDKERLREAVLQEVRSILKERAGRDGVVQVYFTHFVMQ